jgi:predicted AlkP superfamily pyrophosphatase or phosphodiesterase
MRLLAAALGLAFLAAPARASGAPKLTAVVVVDQMRADYLERDPGYSGGFRRLAREGAVFTDAAHLHIPTETCPGHAAISTGREPITNGIVANDWWDRVKGAETYCVADEPYGIGPGHLNGPTLADALKAADPKARVFSVSGKDRAAVLLGGRRPDLALWLDKPNGVFTTSSYYRRPAWLDAFNAKLKASGLLPLKDGKVPAEVLAGPAVDEATARLVDEVVAREGVGHGPSKDLLLVSFSATDIVGHRYGTEAPEMVAQLRALDALLGRELASWEKASGGDLVVALTADHGAIPSPEDPSGKALGVRRYDWDTQEAQIEAALQKRWPAAGKKWLLDDALPHLYLNRALAAERGLEWHAFLKEAAALLSTVPGLTRVLVTSDVPELKDSEPFAAVLKRSVRADRAGDLLALQSENALVYDQPVGTSHGSQWSYDARVPLVFWGRGIPAGHHAGPSSPLDIAPTLGRILGLDYPPADGGALRAEVLPTAAPAR